MVAETVVTQPLLSVTVADTAPAGRPPAVAVPLAPMVTVVLLLNTTL
jgi:hypothetical protein